MLEYLLSDGLAFRSISQDFNKTSRFDTTGIPPPQKKDLVKLYF